ncbi:esterase/lipase family protein [Streptomyces sp. NPDC059568]|uniref:esterase/lipase family protein n=1 Tax=Streptomyces sp. NPDC059568 TaxID=3346868 RepID=UPI00369B44B4
MAQEARIDVELTATQSEEKPSAQAAETLAKTLRPGVWFASPARTSRAEDRKPEIWELRSARPYRREVATGTAAVYRATGQKRLTRPFIFADGFNYGPSDLPGLWDHFNAPYAKGRPGFLDQLLDAGIDVVLVGFEQRHTYIQANAGVVISAIQRAIEERHGDAPLIVGGVSMGGMITRYALAEMEHHAQDHQTATYLSWDSPHNGAWIPLVLQQMAYFFEDFPTGDPDAPKQAELIRSPAAQQLLWSWVENAKYSGPVATSSELRKQFLAELEEYGQFPQRPRKLGVANGAGNGVGRELPAGEVVFDWQIPLIAAAKARFQPAKGEHQPIGEMKALGQVRRGNTSYVPALDGAPGGSLDSFGRVADALKADIRQEFRSGCFVPAVSAVALDFDPVEWNVDPCENIESLPAEKSLLDEFKCDSRNTEHSQVTETLAEWVLERLIG